ncbi:MAG: hypothetical protein H0W63_04280 [Gemmatimonadaceae bacterium]|nr:hypothetical protein [Gemmatimonadaceae bacterium]
MDPAKVPTAGVRARCSVCSGIIPVPAGTAAGSAGSSAQHSNSVARELVQPAGDSARTLARTGEFSAMAAKPWAASTPPPPISATPSAMSSPPLAEQVKGPAPQGVTAGAPAPARRPINPFLNKDPNLRAKRLARALVSDIITYQPAKHAEGLRDGTIRDLFKDEIRKSYEEYTAQVGQQLAESTPYFQEALNEVLGGGKKIF